MISAKKYIAMRRAAIILSAVLFVLVMLTAWLCMTLFQGLSAQLAPYEGVWYCEELALTLSYENNTESYLIKDGEKVSCIVSGHKQNKLINIYELQDTKIIDGAPVLYSGALLFSFECLQLEQDYFIVCDDLGITYTFNRSTEGGSVVPTDES